MRSFQFRLARVLQFRESQAAIEDSKLEAMRQTLRSYEAELASVSRSVDQAHRAAKVGAYVQPSALVALDRFESRTKRERDAWRKRIAAQTELVRTQETAVIEARRRVELLKKLRDARRSEWEEESSHELEAMVADFSAAQWNRR